MWNGSYSQVDDCVKYMDVESQIVAVTGFVPGIFQSQIQAQLSVMPYTFNILNYLFYYITRKVTKLDVEMIRLTCLIWEHNKS